MEKKMYSIDCQNYGKNQIEKSYTEIENIRLKLWDEINKIYKTTEALENKRNIANAESHEKRLKMLEDFDNNLPEQLNEVEEKVKSLMEIEQADKLQEEFDKFKEHCESIMKKKKNLIVEFTKELDLRDQTYVDNVKEFHQNIIKMLELMSEQFSTLRDKMLDHLILIEDEFTKDRLNIINVQYTTYIESLITNLDKVGTEKEKELTNLQDQLEDNAENLAKKKENDFINKVILMETHLNYIKEKVEEFLYEIKILFEKLEYRIKIRDEKIKEAEDKKEQFTTRDGQLSDKINKYNEIYKSKDLFQRKQNQKLRNELIKMTDSYEDLKLKFQHFEKHDELRFKQIYEMKSKEARELACKVVLADRTIKTQQLGTENFDSDYKDGFSLEELQKDQELDETENDLQQKEKNEEKRNQNFKQNIMEKISIPRVKQVFEYIIIEAEFLIETEVIEKCRNLSMDEKIPICVESICKALNIKNEHELNELLDLFYKRNLNDKIDKNEKGEEESEDENVKKASDEILIDADEVVDILIEFFNEKKRKAKEKIHHNATSTEGGSNDLIEDNEEAKRERMKYLSETYWEKLGNTISPKTFNVWKALDDSLTSYHDLLFERKKLVNEVKDLNEKHTELQKLLNQYMNSDVNKELIVPPQKTIKG